MNSKPTTKPLLRYLFPKWDSSRIESMIAVSLHYFALAIFVPLSIFHNLHGIDALQGIAYYWMAGLVCVLDLFIALFLAISYEFYQSHKLVRKDAELSKALEQTPNAKSFLVNESGKNMAIMASLLVLFIAGTITLSLRGGFNSAETSTIEQHKPTDLSSLKADAKSEYKEDLSYWTNYFDSKIEQERKAMDSHLKSVEYKGKVNIHNEATKKVVATHTENINRHESNKSDKLAELAKLHSSTLSNLEVEHSEQKAFYMNKMDSNQSFALSFVWGFSLLNLLFVTFSLLLNTEAHQNYLFPILQYRLKEYYANRKKIHQEAREMQTDSIKREKEWYEIQTNELKQDHDKREELEEMIMQYNTIKEMSDKADSTPIQMSDEFKADLVNLWDSMNKKRDGTRDPELQLQTETVLENGQVLQVANESDFFAGQEVELDIEQIIEQIRSGSEQTDSPANEMNEPERPEQKNPERSDKINPKKSLADYERSHPLMVKFIKLEAKNGFTRGWTGRVQKAMIADDSYQGESTSKGTMHTISKLF